jgi:hypothetical protein
MVARLDIETRSGKTPVLIEMRCSDEVGAQVRQARDNQGVTNYEPSANRWMRGIILANLLVRRMLPARRNVDGHAVGIGKLKLSVLALGEQLEPDIAFGAAGFWREGRVSIDQFLQIFFERFDILNSESQVIHMPWFDAGAFEVGDRPGRDDRRHPAVGEIVVGIVGGLFPLLKLVDFTIELREIGWVKV